MALKVNQMLSALFLIQLPGNLPRKVTLLVQIPDMGKLDGVPGYCLCLNPGSLVAAIWKMKQKVQDLSFSLHLFLHHFPFQTKINIFKQNYVFFVLSGNIFQKPVFN